MRVKVPIYATNGAAEMGHPALFLTIKDRAMERACGLANFTMCERDRIRYLAFHLIRPQGLKPISIQALIGTTEAVPFPVVPTYENQSPHSAAEEEMGTRQLGLCSGLRG